MKQYIEERVLEIANYMLSTKATVRQVAKEFKISKSTVHIDMSKRLPQIKPQLSKEVRKVLDYNNKEKHERGGIATKNRYINMR